MALSEIFFLAIVFYLLYRFVFHFLLPIGRATKQVRQQFQNMQEMQDGMRQQQARAAEPQRKATSKPTVGEYIDFEEVKE